jgi:hypothetical protein
MKPEVTATRVLSDQETELAEGGEARPHSATHGPATPIRNRIKAHRRVRAGDLLPHELNYRLHPAHQRAALDAIYQEIGFARSLLAYESADGRLKLIDGHLRRDMDPDMDVDVEVLDVNDAEARALLLSIDPLADLAVVQEQIHQRLMQLTPTPSPDLEALWKEAEARIDRALKEKRAKKSGPGAPGGGDDPLAHLKQEIPEQLLILLTCRDEKEQTELLARFTGEGYACKALIS